MDVVPVLFSFLIVLECGSDGGRTEWRCCSLFFLFAMSRVGYQLKEQKK